MGNKKGFTLIEVLIVVVIIAISASLIFPRFQESAKKAQLAEAIQILGFQSRQIIRNLNLGIPWNKDTQILLPRQGGIRYSLYVREIGSGATGNFYGYSAGTSSTSMPYQCLMNFKISADDGSLQWTACSGHPEGNLVNSMFPEAQLRACSNECACFIGSG